MCAWWVVSNKAFVTSSHHQYRARFAAACNVYTCCSEVNSGLPPLEAPIMIAEKRKPFFSFLCSEAKYLAELLQRGDMLQNHLGQGSLHEVGIHGMGRQHCLVGIHT